MYFDSDVMPNQKNHVGRVELTILLKDKLMRSTPWSAIVNYYFVVYMAVDYKRKRIKNFLDHYIYLATKSNGPNKFEFFWIFKNIGLEVNCSGRLV
jgi:hypothetical protein